MQRCESTAVLSKNPQEPNCEHSDRTFHTDVQLDHSQTSPSKHVVGILRRRSLQFSTFCEVEQKWEITSKKIDLTHTIDCFRDAVMIPFKNDILIFNMRNRALIQAQNLSLDTFSVKNIALSNDVECAGLALFCLLNDEIYCFARSDHQFFYK